MARGLWQWLAWGFGLLWLMALALFIVGTFGLFGSPSGRLAGVFLIPLGLPWGLALAGLPEQLLPWAGALAPGINLAILIWLARRANRT
jgi:hypothetical protein